MLRCSAIAFAAALLASSAHAQSVDSILATIRSGNSWTLAQQKSICEIAAPPFGESARGAEFARRLRALGLDTRVDAAGNVIAERPDTPDGPPVIVLAGHLDTVFPEGTDVQVREDGGRMRAPGIGDDCRGLAVVLAVARAFQREAPTPGARIVFVGDVGEEGPGNLRGVRHLFDREFNDRIDYFISVDGAGLNFVSRAVGSIRYAVTYKGPGGHSYGAFGIPNPVHALGRAISAIADIRVPESPRTTFNVGVIDGGTSVNSIAFAASMQVDMRSESAGALAALDGTVRRALQQALDAENARWTGPRAAAARVTMDMDTIGIRPTGAQADTARIVRVAMETALSLGFSPRHGASSTDANIPISLGVPAITIDGGGRGGGAHSPGEWYEDGTAGYLGPQWAALIVATLAGLRG